MKSVCGVWGCMDGWNTEDDGCLQFTGLAESGSHSSVVICFMTGHHDTLWHPGKLHPGAPQNLFSMFTVEFEPFQTTRGSVTTSWKS